MLDIIRSMVNAKLMGPVVGGTSGGGSGIPQEDIDAAFAALSEKGVAVPDGATSADLDDLIASIATSGISFPWLLIDTITISESATSSQSINLVRYGYDLTREKYPIAVFLCEVGYGKNDTSHEGYRPFMVFAATDPDAGSVAVANGIYVRTYTNSTTGELVNQCRSGSNTSLAQFWTGLSPTGASIGNVMGGNITETKATLTLNVSGDYGVVPGRTYLWGVVL